MNRARKSFKYVAASAVFLSLTPTAGLAGGAGADRTCSRWAQLTDADHSNSEPLDLGCTNRRNLEHMAEDPRDIERGRDLGPADAEREARAVKIYEEGKVQFSGSTTGQSGFLLGPVTPTQGSQ